MRFGPFHISRAAAEQPTPKVSPERGSSGTINQDGYLLPDEYNTQLRWPYSLKTYERMRRSDAAVREALQHIYAPILNATWAVEAASEDPLDLEVAEFVRRSYFDWPIDPFEETLRQALHHLTFGVQLFELVDQVVEDALTWDDPVTGEPVTGPVRQFVTWRRWAHRKPGTVERWHVEEGELVSVQQQAALKDNRLVAPTIPAEALVVFTNEKEGDDFTGMSILRTAYKAWRLKEVIEKVMGVGVERHGTGIPVVYVPDDLKNDDATLDRIEQMMKGLRAGEFPYLVFPGPKGQAASAGGGSGGFWFEIVAPSGGVPDFSGPLEYLRGEIKGNMLARFSELGHGSTGARSTGDTQSEVWYDALHAVARYMQSVHRGAIRRLVDKNYLVDRYPQLVARDIEARSLTEFADFVAKLTSTGAIKADKSLRQAVRQAGDLPDEDEDADTEEPVDDQPDGPIEDDPTDV